ncbi:MAG: histidine kinase [Flavobacteriaceae bacterium]|nr:histidine kinase [Flavobacteriaceae bacterium]
MKKHSIIIFSSIVLSIVLSYYLAISGTNTDSEFTVGVGFFASIFGVLTTYLLYFITKKLDKFFPWQTHTNSRLFVGLFVQYSIVVSIAVTGFYIYARLFTTTEAFFTVHKETLIKIYLLLFIAILIYTIVYFAFYSYYSFATLQIETVKQECKQIDLQLKALKSQISPHFLFNSLNTISSLVHTDVKRTTLFIRRLAKMYQYTLQSYHSKVIPLKEELDFVSSYLYLLETRFRNKFTASIEIEEDLYATNIPPLTLQMLVENAVKHNVMDDEHPLQIKIFKDNAHICVQNTITKSPENKVSFKIGLKNINQRYLLLVNQGIVVSNGAVFSVKVPIIR